MILLIGKYIYIYFREKNTVFGFLGSLIENMLSFSPSK